MMRRSISNYAVAGIAAVLTIPVWSSFAGTSLVVASDGTTANQVSSDSASTDNAEDAAQDGVVKLIAPTVKPTVAPAAILPELPKSSAPATEPQPATENLNSEATVDNPGVFASLSDDTSAHESLAAGEASVTENGRSVARIQVIAPPFAVPSIADSTSAGSPVRIAPIRPIDGTPVPTESSSSALIVSQSSYEQSLLEKNEEVERFADPSHFRNSSAGQSETIEIANPAPTSTYSFERLPKLEEAYPPHDGTRQLVAASQFISDRSSVGDDGASMPLIGDDGRQISQELAAVVQHVTQAPLSFVRLPKVERIADTATTSFHLADHEQVPVVHTSFASPESSRARFPQDAEQGSVPDLKDISDIEFGILRYPSAAAQIKVSPELRDQPLAVESGGIAPLVQNQVRSLKQGESDQGWYMSYIAWAAPAFYHRPLYFEEVNLERYGHYKPIFQPAISAGHFYGNFLMLPYQLWVTPPCEPIYTLGHHRPGSCNPHQIHYFPIGR